jgi:hypothetical protein
MKPTGTLIAVDGKPVLCAVANDKHEKLNTDAWVCTPLTTSAYDTSVRPANNLITGFTFSHLSTVLKTGFRTVLLQKEALHPMLFESENMTCVLMPARVGDPENIPGYMSEDAVAV